MSVLMIMIYGSDCILAVLSYPIPQPKSTLSGPSSLAHIADPGHLGVHSESEAEEEVGDVTVRNENDKFFL